MCAFSKIGGNGHIYWVMLPGTEKKLEFQARMKERGVRCFSHYVALHSSGAGEKFSR